MFEMTPSQTKQSIIKCIKAGVVPFVTSSPGLGKSSIVSEIADYFSMELIDIRLSQCAPEDLMGLPMRSKDGKTAEFVPFKMFPSEDTPLPKDKNGWIIFFDEFNSGSKSVQAAAYKPILDHMVGQMKLHPNAVIVCAGNLATDRAIVNSLSTAMQSRLVHIEMTPDLEEFMDHAHAKGFDSRVLGFLEYQPGKLHDFKPDHTDKTFPCPRTWEFVSRLIKGDAYEDIDRSLLAGAIGGGTATEFHTFLKEFESLPKLVDIIADPEGTFIPPESSSKYALVSMLMEKFDENDFAKVAMYVQRLTTEFQVLYFRNIVKRHPAFRRTPAYRNAMKHLTEFLYDTTDKAA